MAVRIFDDEDLAKLKEVLDSGHLNAVGGKYTALFERAFAEAVGARHGVAMNAAMSVLHAAVAAARAGAGDEVIVDPMFHFAGLAAMYNNAVPIFADLQPDTFNVDPTSIRARVSPHTKAILVTHAWGLPCDMDAIMEVAREHSLVVIEDCAHALFATYKGRCAGTLGHIGSFSFQQSKHMATGDGGIGVTDDEKLRARMRDVAGYNFGAVAPCLAWNYRMTELVAAVALVQLERARQYVAETVANAQLYNEAVREIPWLVPQRVPEGHTHVYHVWVCRFDGERYGVSREAFLQALKEEGCAASIGYTGKPAYLFPTFAEPIAYGRGCPLHCPLYQGRPNYRPGACPVAEEIIPRQVLVGTTGPRGRHAQNAGRLQRAAARC